MLRVRVFRRFNLCDVDDGLLFFAYLAERFIAFSHASIKARIAAIVQT
jgi:hypothetical protein